METYRVEYHQRKTLPSDRHYLSCDDCLEDKRGDHQNCSVLYCIELCCIVYHNVTLL